MSSSLFMPSNLRIWKEEKFNLGTCIYVVLGKPPNWQEITYESTGLKNDLYLVSPPNLWYLAALIQSSKNKWKTMLDIAQKAKQ